MVVLWVKHPVEMMKNLTLLIDGVSFLIKEDKFSCLPAADNYTCSGFIFLLIEIMLTKRQIYLVIFAVLSVLLAVGTLFYLRELDRRLQEPLQEEFIYEETPVVPVSDSSSSS